MSHVWINASDGDLLRADQIAATSPRSKDHTMQYVKEWPIRELAAGRASVDLGNRLLQTGETDLDDIKDVRVRFAR